MVFFIFFVFLNRNFQLGDRGDLDGGRTAFRILDAAFIGGDNVSFLPFDERMAAAEKMCKAVNLLNPDKSIPVYTAKVILTFFAFLEFDIFGFRRACRHGLQIRNPTKLLAIGVGFVC